MWLNPTRSLDCESAQPGDLKLELLERYKQSVHLKCTNITFTDFDCDSVRLADLSPFRTCPTRSLDCESAQPADLKFELLERYKQPAHLKCTNITFTNFDCDSVRLADLSPFRTWFGPTRSLNCDSVQPSRHTVGC